jgi:hypothetical protein
LLVVYVLFCGEFTEMLRVSWQTALLTKVVSIIAEVKSDNTKAATNAFRYIGINL